MLPLSGNNEPAAEETVHHVSSFILLEY